MNQSHIMLVPLLPRLGCAAVSSRLTLQKARDNSLFAFRAFHDGIEASERASFHSQQK